MILLNIYIYTLNSKRIRDDGCSLFNKTLVPKTFVPKPISDQFKTAKEATTEFFFNFL